MTSPGTLPSLTEHTFRSYFSRCRLTGLGSASRPGTGADNPVRSRDRRVQERCSELALAAAIPPG